VDVISALEQSYGQTAELVDGITPDELSAPSPCAGWDVRATLNHLLSATWMFTLVNQGQAADEDAGDVVGDDATLAVTAAAKENLASWRQPGAFEDDRCYFFGTFPAAGAAMLNLGEVVVHNWDVAKATGQELVIGPAVGPSAPKWRCRRQHPSSTVSSAYTAGNPERATGAPAPSRPGNGEATRRTNGSRRHAHCRPDGAGGQDRAMSKDLHSETGPASGRREGKPS
jgi:uncharacterized protein (TIGR03086 family)